jgi:cytochrome c oxidase cbb3-type subunit 1
MATTSLPLPTTGFASTDREIAAIDASVRWPVIFCFLTAVHWMVTGTFLLVYACSLMHPQNAMPILSLLVDLSARCSFFTYGRIWPAAIDCLFYGWASTAGLGLIIWLMARLSHVPVRATAALMTGVVFWNLGISIGLAAIFLGYGNSIELLEFPLFASVVMWFAYALIGIWAVATFLARRSEPAHLAQAWLLAALFAFPWLLAAGSQLLSNRPLPGTGVVQELIGMWYVHGIYTLWLAPIGLAALYYLIPKISGVTVRSTNGRVAFWTWIVLAPWTAVHDLVGSPVPAETVTIGLILSGLIFIPVSMIGFTLVRAAFEGEDKTHHGIVFPFLNLGAVFFVIAGLIEQLLSVRGADDVLRFTMFREANQFIWLFGFFSFIAFGAIYYILPRLLDFGWRSALLIKAHYYASLYGILLVIAMLGFGGVMQGLTLESPDAQVSIMTASQLDFSFYIATTLCIGLVSIGNGIFAFHLAWLLLDWLRFGVRHNRLASEILVEPYTAPEVKA